MVQDSHLLRKGAVDSTSPKPTTSPSPQHMKDHLPGGSTELLATTVRFITLNCRSLSSDLQQAALSELLGYLCVPFAVLQRTRVGDRLVISVGDYTISCIDSEPNKVLNRIKTYTSVKVRIDRSPFLLYL
ncbi:hypothetical protein RB195_021330 [Necator americanus]|uniref:Uncharacterized protein n=1 Tax=Necator americanus TaxID=51031 RepID=A0ABR1EBK5_NECAM